MIVSGRVSHKMAALLRQIYDQMLEPKWVIAMGACASRDVLELRGHSGRGQGRARRRARAWLPALARGAPRVGIVRLQEKILAGVPPAYEIRGVAS